MRNKIITAATSYIKLHNSHYPSNQIKDNPQGRSVLNKLLKELSGVYRYAIHLHELDNAELSFSGKKMMNEVFARLVEVKEIHEDWEDQIFGGYYYMENGSPVYVSKKRAKKIKKRNKRIIQAKY